MKLSVTFLVTQETYVFTWQNTLKIDHYLVEWEYATEPEPNMYIVSFWKSFRISKAQVLTKGLIMNDAKIFDQNIIPCWDFPLGFHDRIYFQHKHKKQHSRGTIWHIRYKHLTRKIFEGQADCWEWDWFYVGNRPILLWLSWSGTVTDKYYSDN